MEPSPAGTLGLALRVGHTNTTFVNVKQTLGWVETKKCLPSLEQAPKGVDSYA
jgi:hypothetical protein